MFGGAWGSQGTLVQCSGVWRSKDTSQGDLSLLPSVSQDLVFTGHCCMYQTGWPVGFWGFSCVCLRSYRRSAGITDMGHHIWCMGLGTQTKALMLVKQAPTHWTISLAKLENFWIGFQSMPVGSLLLGGTVLPEDPAFIHQGSACPLGAYAFKYTP